jgi:hypothetical protein
MEISMKLKTGMMMINNTTMKSIFTLPLIFAIGLICTSFSPLGAEVIQDSVTSAQNTVEEQTGSEFNLFESDELLQMTLSFDIREFHRTKNHPQYFDAALTVKTGEQDSISQQIKLKARGEFRRSYCYFPPIMLKFKNKDQGPLQFSGSGKIKLVTHCNQTDRFNDYVLKEYLAYKLLNKVTPYSFKARLVQINYVDIKKPDRSFTAYGILIENEDDLARRTNSVIVKNENLTQKSMNTADMARVALFNYMIGNTDWSVPLQHNVKILKPIDLYSVKGIPVAYDFDYSGLVNALYATPCDELPIKTVLERHYLGICMGEKEFMPVIEEFRELKGELLGTINDFDYLSTGQKNQVSSYVNSFFNLYTNESFSMTALNRSCKRF